MVRQSINLRTTGRAHENWGQKDTASTAGAHRAGRESCIHLIDLLTVIWVMMCSARMRHATGKKRSKLTLECKSRLLKFCERTQKDELQPPSLAPAVRKTFTGDRGSLSKQKR